MFRAMLLPGGVLPAALAYPALIEALGPDCDARFKELEIYAHDAPPDGYGLDVEVEGILRAADEAGFDRFHLVGYSAGGASSIAFCAAHPERLLSLTLNEPAWSGTDGMTEEEKAVREGFDQIAGLPAEERMARFVTHQLAPGVAAPPPPPSGSNAPPWMATRPEGIKRFVEVFGRSTLDTAALRAFTRPVLFTVGGKSNPSYYAAAAVRLANVFSDFTVERYEDRHHFDPPHRAEPKRMAESLLALWMRAESHAS